MQEMKLNEVGFIMDYLVSGPVETPFTDSTSDADQLHYEKYLRSIIADKDRTYPSDPIVIAKSGRTGMPWRYHYGQGNWFVDYSTFYSVLKKIELDAAVILTVQQDISVKAILWSYAAVDMWCNGVQVCKIEKPVYKPISKAEMVLNLKKGGNLLYVMLQNLGVRDTRTLFGIQICDNLDKICISLPDNEHALPFIKAVQWLSGLHVHDRTVLFPLPAPEGTQIGIDSMSPDYADKDTRIVFHDVSGKKEYKTGKNETDLIAVCTCGREKFSRRFEIEENVLPQYNPDLSVTQNTERIYQTIAHVVTLDRGTHGFAMPNILARKAVHEERPDDREQLLITLQQIEDRYDCSDFLLSGLIRYLKNYKVEAALNDRIQTVLLNYRYWMNQNGSDAMCFWSENHSLLFYSNAMFVGQMYPEAYFPRAGMKGKDLSEFGKHLVEQWLSDIEKQGFEEFLSTVYMCVTFAGLLNVIDYAEPAISERTKKIADRLLHMLALHTFKGSIIAPMGRVYREIIYPFKQGAQALMNLANPTVPDSYGEGWLSWYATSLYHLPSDLVHLMDTPVSTEYTTGNALIRLEKQKDWCLTSVQSPREDPGFKRWENLTLDADKRTVSHAYTKSINERFHGTTCFEPGVYGYQQHMWSAALDPETHVFTNHPGGTVDSSSMRPGYWYGNGVMPAIKQEKNHIGIIYEIPDSYPIHFTHLFWPSVKFDQTEKAGNWLFGRKGNGYIGVWCSRELKPYDDELAGCEYRAYGDKTAWWCICGSASEDSDFSAFCRACTVSKPVFTEKEGVLSVAEEQFSLGYIAHKDTTQYI